MKQKGFTLIELLVVIAIIGMLSTVILLSLNSARSRARDARRLADVNQLQKALELYYANNNQYPASGGAVNGPNSAWSNSSDASWLSGSVFANAMAPFMQTLPKDPANQSGWIAGTYQLSYYSCGRAYMIVYTLERPAGYTSPGVNVCGVFYQYPGTGVMTVGAGGD